MFQVENKKRVSEEELARVAAEVEEMESAGAVGGWEEEDLPDCIVNEVSEPQAILEASQSKTPRWDSFLLGLRTI